MIVFFEEKDLVSFGNYLLSEYRRNNVIANSEGESEEVIQQRIDVVSNFDLQHWGYLQSQQYQQPVTNEEEINESKSNQ